MRSILFQSFLRSFRNIFLLNGRASRFDYWALQVVYGTIFFFALSLTELFFPSMHYVLDSIEIILGIIGLPLNFSVTIKRLHDLNKTGFYFMLTPIPFINLFLFIYIGFFSGDIHKNKYGNPVARLSNKMEILDFVWIGLLLLALLCIILSNIAQPHNMI